MKFKAISVIAVVVVMILATAVYLVSRNNTQPVEQTEQVEQ